MPSITSNTSFAGVVHENQVSVSSAGKSQERTQEMKKNSLVIPIFLGGATILKELLTVLNSILCRFCQQIVDIIYEDNMCKESGPKTLSVEVIAFGVLTVYKMFYIPILRT